MIGKFRRLLKVKGIISGWLVLCGFALFTSFARGQDNTPRLPPGESFHVEAVVDNPSPYFGQQIVYTFRFYTDDLPQFTYEAPDFQDFWRSGQVTRSYVELVDGRQYTVVVTDIVLHPTRDGIVTIQPSVLIIPESVFSDRPRLELATEALTVNIQPLPTDPPPGFSGAVGRLEMQVAVDTQTVGLGQPVLLRVRVSGIGNLDLIAPPDITIPDGWRSYPNPSNTSTVTTQGADANGSPAGAQISGVRTFEWRLIPERAGSHTFAAIEFSYFDPEDAAYRTQSTQPFTIDVLPGSDGARELPSFTADQNGVLSLALKPIPTALTDSQNGIGAGFWLTWLIPPGMVGLVWGGLYLHRTRERRRIARRWSGALRKARQNLQDVARTAASTINGHTQIERAIVAYVEDKRDRDALTAGEARATLLGLQIDAGLIESVLACLNRAEDGRYAPEGLLNPAKLAAESYEALAALDKAWMPEGVETQHVGA